MPTPELRTEVGQEMEPHRGIPTATGMQGCCESAWGSKGLTPGASPQTQEGWPAPRPISPLKAIVDLSNLNSVGPSPLL